MTADGVLGESTADRGERNDAEAFLRELLANGEPLSAADALTAARRNGVSERTLRRAKSRLHVRSKLVGFGRDGQWRWWLPLSERLQATTVSPTDVAASGDQQAKTPVFSQRLPPPQKMAASDGTVRRAVLAGWSVRADELVPVTRVAVSMLDDGGNRDIYIYELDRGTPTRLTFDPGRRDPPVWTSDGQVVAFRSAREGGGIFARRADGTGDVARLTRPVWSADDSQIYFFRLGSTPVTREVWVADRDGSNARRVTEIEPIGFISPAFDVAPDGRIVWIQDRPGRQRSGRLRSNRELSLPAHDLATRRRQLTTTVHTRLLCTNRDEWSANGGRVWLPTSTTGVQWSRCESRLDDRLPDRWRQTIESSTA